MVPVDTAPQAWERLDAAGLLTSPPAKAALTRLVERLRAAGYRNRPDDGPLAALALGRSVDPSALVGLLEPADMDALCRVGAADRHEEGVALRFGLFAAGDVVAVVPRSPEPHPEMVYLGKDSFWLLRTLWRLAPGGDLAVELGTGTGYLAAVLLRRYRTVVATDILPTTAAVAALTLAINGKRPGNGARRGGVVVADVAGGLRAGCADLVTANAPWVPAPPPDGRTRVFFAEGGPSGTELPLRFIEEGAALLRPGGLGVFQCLDVTRRDGVRPLADLCDSLTARGLIAEICEIDRAGAWPGLEEWVARVPLVMSARLVTVVVRRPPEVPARHLVE